MFEWIQDIIETIASSIGTSTAFVEKVLWTLLLILLLWTVRKVVDQLVYRRVEDQKARYSWNRGARYVVYVIGIILVGRIWFEGIASLATYLGLLSAGLAVALKDPIANMAGWLFILWRSPFEVGDRIEIGDHAGDVIDLRLFQFTILEIGNWVDADQSTGRIIHIPNGRVFTHDQANYTKAFSYVWDEIGVLVTFESDWKRAKEILQRSGEALDDLEEGAREHLRRASSRYMIFYNKLTPIVYTSVEDSGVMLTLRYLTQPRRRRLRKEELWETILDAFAKEERIDLAYPTQRLVWQRPEGGDPREDVR